VKSIGIALLFFFALPLAAQTAHPDLLGVQDNSFLIEEAYNQGPGVIQSLGVFTLVDDAWELSFTQELPLHGLKHQISYDIPVNEDGLSDVAVHYRYQWLGDAEADLAIAPRVSVIFPTSQDGGDTGISLGLPISYVLAPRIASHTNVEVTFRDGTEISLGQSFVYAFSSRAHALIEGVWSDADDSEVVISPGVRWAYNRPSGWQVVPGVAVMFGEETGALLYLSFEK
jgi:hypothetical protein